MDHIQRGVLQQIQARTHENPVTGKELIRTLSITEDPKTFGASLRELINELRVMGYPICATGTGYYWPRTMEEFEDYVGRFYHRIEKQREAYASLQNVMLKVRGELARGKTMDDLKVNAQQTKLL